MEILKATVRFRNKSGLYPVYIRFTQVKQVSYVKTSWTVSYTHLTLPTICSV